LTDAPHARLTIDLDALAANFRVLTAVAGDAEVAAVVKADGYGLGAGPVARRLWAEGARRFFVARLEEGERLREALAGRDAVIHVLDGAPPGAMARLAKAKLVPILNSLDQIAGATAFAAGHGRLEAGLHIDTGMNRLGLRPEEARALALAPHGLAGLDISLVMSHLACASDPAHPMNALQLARFLDAAADFPGARLSLANSGGLFLGEAYRFDVVRPGITLYGGGPFDRPDARLRPVVSFEAPILQIRTAPAGETVGYGASQVVDGPRRLAIVGAGYANGFLRSSGGDGGAVWFDGDRRPIVGRVSMDVVTIDITGSTAAHPGAMVELIGPNAPLDDAALAAGTAPHELLVRIGTGLLRTSLGAAD
jgi:alanine racemase